MESGVYVCGLYISAQEFENRGEDGNIRVSHTVLVAVGVTAYRVYLKRGEFEKLSGYAMGDHIQFAVRAVSGKSGVSFVSGEIVE